MKFTADVSAKAADSQSTSEALIEADDGPIVIQFGSLEKFAGFPADRESVYRRAKYSHAEIDEVEES